MNKDLFGKKVKIKTEKDEKYLKRYDNIVFKERLKRLQYINKILPKGVGMLGQMEVIFTYKEAQLAYINGEFISVLLLAQAFIEKLISGIFLEKGLKKEFKKGLSSMINYAKENKLINDFLLDKIDNLRNKRNPFTHLKPMEHKYNLTSRITKDIFLPEKILEKDANEAVELMICIASQQLE